MDVRESDRMMVAIAWLASYMGVRPSRGGGVILRCCMSRGVCRSGETMVAPSDRSILIASFSCVRMTGGGREALVAMMGLDSKQDLLSYTTEASTKVCPSYSGQEKHDRGAKMEKKSKVDCAGKQAKLSVRYRKESKANKSKVGIRSVLVLAQVLSLLQSPPHVVILTQQVRKQIGRGDPEIILVQ
nr:hypothetical protein CFP56_04518 [Quercus suber]